MANGDFAYFNASDGFKNGNELWVTDGKKTMVHPLMPNSLSSNPKNLVPGNGGVFFVADTQVLINGRKKTRAQIWIAAGFAKPGIVVDTVKLDIAAPRNLVYSERHGKLYFDAFGLNPATKKREWLAYQRDNLSGLTTLVPNAPGPIGFVRKVLREIYFLRHSPTSPYQVWRLTKSGAKREYQPFKTWNTAKQGPYPRFIDWAIAKDRPVFALFTSQKGTTLWTVNQQGDIAEMPSSPIVRRPLVSAGDRVFFAGGEAKNPLNLELWQTTGGKATVFELLPGPIGSNPQNIIKIGFNTVAFSARQVRGSGPNFDVHLAISDGKPTGTKAVAKMLFHLYPRAVDLKGRLYMAAGAAVRGLEPWVACPGALFPHGTTR